MVLGRLMGKGIRDGRWECSFIEGGLMDDRGLGWCEEMV